MEFEKLQSVVRKGRWLYENLIEKEVRIIKQNWDYYYEDGYSYGEPHLNNEGFAFYVVFDKPLEDGNYSSRSETLYSIDEAVKFATESVSGTVIWD